MRFSSSLRAFTVLAVLGAALFGTQAQGHASGENYVFLNVAEEHLEGRFEIRLPDLRKHFGFDLPEDYESAVEALPQFTEAIHSYLLANFEATANGEPVVFEFTTTDILLSESYGHFAQFYFETPEMVIPDELEITNTVLLDGSVGRLHRSLICMDFNVKTGLDREASVPSEGEVQKIATFVAAVFAPGTTEQTLDLTRSSDALIPVKSFIEQGVLHIWIGIDHILFLVALLLTAVLYVDKTTKTWEPTEKFGTAFFKILKIVTLFTIAHSITLSLASLSIIQLPSRLVESIIAFSILVILVNNFRPRFNEASWVVIFIFGLFHGLGFASVMGELPFRVTNLAKVVLFFNVGVEIGQAAIVLVIFPILFALRKWKYYRPVILWGGSGLIAIQAAWWFAERAFNL